MALRVAINGFGRIGRLVLRAITETGRKDIQVVAINDLAPLETNAHLFRFDSVHGRYPHPVKTGDGTMDVGMGEMRVTNERDPAALPWGTLGVDVALECTGIFASKEKAAPHLKAGAKKVLISAPASGADLTVVFGVNDDKLTREHTVVSNASCTTNCLAPMAYVLHKAIGIARGYMTTIHAYTNDQHVLDIVHKDLRRARAAALSMIPTSTGAARAVGLVLPELKGKLDGSAVRVPTPNVSMVDLVFTPARTTTTEEVNKAMIDAAKTPRLKNVLSIVDEPLVSIDFNHNPASCSFDVTQTQVIDGTLVRVLGWYDNEWGFANRMADTATAMGKLI